MRTTAPWLLLGVFALLACQPSEAGTGDHSPSGTSTEHPRSYDEYVAIGDSFTAGSGIRPMDGSGCLRSDRNYPSLLADRLDAHLHDDSCGGATAVQVETAQPTSVRTNPPQLSEVDRQTDLVTISLGLNDTGYGNLIMQCISVAATDPQGSPCRASFQTPSGDAILSALPDFGHDLARVIRLVHRAAPSADVVVVGYPQLVSSTTCADVPFAAGDYGYLAEYLLDLNSVMKEAASDADASYVDVMSASKGHDICAGDDAWALGNIGSPRTITWHPFANEQRAIAALIEQKLEEGP